MSSPNLSPAGLAGLGGPAKKAAKKTERKTAANKKKSDKLGSRSGSWAGGHATASGIKRGGKKRSQKSPHSVVKRHRRSQRARSRSAASKGDDKKLLSRRTGNNIVVRFDTPVLNLRSFF
ncbi:uncharacterized protein LOC129593891 [Paramacrobiotus metropolitanus]|uniref:uncharacterized protein LOC129593891 n=1 Tax=Paramacrobiotus metropolitanus TaxID=2943436 RepID=UPI0024458160|nr:uncharacterized protein LOC129593891 [Paramacrobiotus metropolitanus]